MTEEETALFGTGIPTPRARQVNTKINWQNIERNLGKEIHQNLKLKIDHWKTLRKEKQNIQNILKMYPKRWPKSYQNLQKRPKGAKVFARRRPKTPGWRQWCVRETFGQPTSCQHPSEVPPGVVLGIVLLHFGVASFCEDFGSIGLQFGCLILG